MRPAGRMRPFASTPAARTKDTVIWSFNGQNCSFYNLNWIHARRSQKNCPILFFIQNNFYTCKYDRLFPSVKNILNRENILSVRHVKHAARGPHVVCGPHDNTNETHMALGEPSVWHACSRPYGNHEKEYRKDVWPTCNVVISGLLSRVQGMKSFSQWLYVFLSFQIFSWALLFSMTGKVVLQTTRNQRHKEWYRILNK
jgi:hypothetical protein